MHSARVSPECLAQSPDEYELPFLFSFSDDMGGLRDVTTPATAAEGPGKHDNESSLIEPADTRSGQRHSSGDTAPSSSESLSNIFNPWGVFSPADSTKTSMHTTSFGSGSFSSIAAAWPHSPPPPALQPQLPQQGLDSEARIKHDPNPVPPLVRTGGTMGPLDSHLAIIGDNQHSKGSATGIFDAPRARHHADTTQSTPDKALSHLFNSEAHTNTVPFSMPKAQDFNRHEGLHESTKITESLYSTSMTRPASMLRGHSEQRPDQRQASFDPDAQSPWPHMVRDANSLKLTDVQHFGGESHDDLRGGATHQQHDLYSWATPDRAKGAYAPDSIRSQTPYAPFDSSLLGASLQQQSSNTLSRSPFAPFSNSVQAEYSIFVGDLCPDLREEDLVAQFLHPPCWPPSHPFAVAHAHAQQAQGNYSTPPKIAPAPFMSTKSATIMTDPLTGASRGFGFVRFSSETDCARALIEMQSVIISPKNGQGGRPLRVCPATPKNRSSSTSSPNAASSLSALGERIFGATTLTQQHSTPSALTPMKPFSSATPPAYPPSSSQQLGIVPPLQAGDSSASQFAASALDPSNTTVFVGGLSSLISEETLKTFFVPFGEIKYVKIPPGKGCGFVQFVRKMDAERAIERMQGFPIGGGRIRLSWGRSQGDKAAAAAAHAAAQAAQIGHLAGLAGLNALTTSQLTAATLANSTNLGTSNDTSSLLMRQLSAVAAAASAGREDPTAIDELRNNAQDLLPNLHFGGDLTSCRVNPSQQPATEYQEAQQSSTPSNTAQIGRTSHAALWPEAESTSLRSQTLSDSQMTNMFGSMRLSNSQSGGNFPQDANVSLLRERSQTFTLGSAHPSPSPIGRLSPYPGVFAAYGLSSLAYHEAEEVGNRTYGSMPPAPLSPTPKRSLNTLLPGQRSLFQPFSPAPSRAASASPSEHSAQQHLAGSLQQAFRGSPENTRGFQAEVSDESYFKRYLEQQRNREREQQQQQHQQQQQQQQQQQEQKPQHLSEQP